MAVILGSGSLLVAPAAQTPAATTTDRTFTHTALGMTVLGATIDLPRGQWEVAAVMPAGAVDQVFLVPERPPDELVSGRTATAGLRQIAASIPERLEFLFEAIAIHAATHSGVGPKSFADIDPQTSPFVQQAIASPWPGDADRMPPIPYVFLMPGARVQSQATSRGAGRGATPARTPLVLELRPFEDDGRHWVLFANGEVERVPIDAMLVAKHKLTITPVQRSGTAKGPDAGVVHRLYGMRRAATAAAVTVTVVDTWSSARRDIRWTLAGGKSDPDVIGEWALARGSQWYPLAAYGNSPIMQAWLHRLGDIYGSGAGGLEGLMPQMRRAMGEAAGGGPRSTSAFDVLGGRAALRETLQVELIRARNATASPARFSAARPVVPISMLTGVEVQALPFDQMLAGRAGGRIALADYVPEDRLFIYFAKPSAVFPFLTQGGDLVGRFGSTVTATAFDDNLKRRYLGRLGLPEESSRKLLESGAITELALTAPDLFFLDGTDLTVLMRLREPAAAVALGALAGVTLTGSAVVERRTPAGRAAYWSLQGDVLALSTSRREVEHARRLGQNGAGSLGQSAELRYMLTELPVRTETRALIYFSDHFIRRVVGPAVKIGQLRRMRAAAEMTIITAGALLYKLDGHTGTPDLATLSRLGYVAPGIPAGDYRIQPDFSVVSPQWGTLAELTTLDAMPIEFVTQEEADAYRTYVEEYRRYWRQYFDPIAMRLDDAPDGSLELSTFILPLVESQLYGQLGGIIQTKETGKPLRVPQLTPAPVMQLSLNLSDAAWGGLSSGFGESFSQFTGISSELFDMFGPGLHIAVQDADPVISLGTSDLLGAFGGSALGAGFDVAIPFALSLLTRPCKIYIELQDPAKALTLMRRAASVGGARRELEVAFRQIGNRDAWTYTFGVPGVARFRLGLEIQNGYLVVSNIPWSDKVAIDRVEARPLNGAAIQLRPDAVKLGLASLFATQAEQDQTAALASMAALMPLLQTVATTPADAATRHAALFGTMPLHPGPGDWLWTNGKLESSRYGSDRRWKAPAFDPAQSNFGLFDGATLLDLTMQLEQGGLRATARWRWKDAAAAR